MTYFPDSDDLDFAILVLPRLSSPLAWFVALVLVLVCAGIVVYSADECADRCDGNGRVLENACYCVESDGSLRIAETRSE